MGPRRPCNYQRSWWALGRQGRATWGDGPRGPVGRVSATWWGPDHTHLTADAAAAVTGAGPTSTPTSTWHLATVPRADRTHGWIRGSAAARLPCPIPSRMPSCQILALHAHFAPRSDTKSASIDHNLSTVPQCKASKRLGQQLVLLLPRSPADTTRWLEEKCAALVVMPTRCLVSRAGTYVRAFVWWQACRNEYGCVRSSVRLYAHRPGMCCVSLLPELLARHSIYTARQKGNYYLFILFYLFWFTFPVCRAGVNSIPNTHSAPGPAVHACTASSWTSLSVWANAAAAAAPRSADCSAGHLAEPAGALDETRERETAQPKATNFLPANVRVN